MIEIRGEDWGVLRTGGINGFLVVMLLLCWWGHVDGSADWKGSVEDAKSCLEKMVHQKWPSDVTGMLAQKIAQMS
jgi:hypothetical protein